MAAWKELKNSLSIDKETQNAIDLEKDLIRTMVAIREEKGLTQSQLAEMCHVNNLSSHVWNLRFILLRLTVF